MTRIDHPQNRRSQETRAAILDATWRLLEQRGAADTTMAAVAEAAGVSRRAMYLHFASRGELFLALRETVDERLDLERSVRPVTEAPDAVQSLDAWARHVVTYHSRIASIMRAVDRIRHEDPDAEALWNEARGRWYEGCEWLATRLADEARLAPPWTVATAADLLRALMAVDLIDELGTERGWGEQLLTERLQLVARRTLVVDPREGGKG